MRTRNSLGGLAVAALMITGLGLGSSAQAADMAVKAPRALPPPVFSWTGFYIGGFAGAAWADHVTTTDPCLSTALAACLAAGVGTFNGVQPSVGTFDTSFAGGGEIGYNWQINPFIVLGLENKFGYLHLHSSAIQNPGPGGVVSGTNDTNAITTIGNWYDAYTARVGAVDGHAMFFLEGGGVTARVTTGVLDVVGVTLNTQTSKTVTGWAAGGGVEYAFDAHWSVKGEYLALGLNTNITGCGVTSTGFNDCTVSKIPVVSTAYVGLNYRF